MAAVGLAANLEHGWPAATGTGTSGLVKKSADRTRGSEHAFGEEMAKQNADWWNGDQPKADCHGTHPLDWPVRWFFPPSCSAASPFFSRDPGLVFTRTCIRGG
jgi:hypothetical protein